MNDMTTPLLWFTYLLAMVPTSALVWRDAPEVWKVAAILLWPLTALVLMADWLAS